MRVGHGLGGDAADGLGERVAEEGGAVVGHAVALVFLVAVADAGGVIGVTVADKGDDPLVAFFLGNERVAVGADFKAGLGELVDGVLDFHFLEVLVVGLLGRRALRCDKQNPNRFRFPAQKNTISKTSQTPTT